MFQNYTKILWYVHNTSTKQNVKFHGNPQIGFGNINTYIILYFELLNRKFQEELPILCQIVEIRR